MKCRSIEKVLNRKDFALLHFEDKLLAMNSEDFYCQQVISRNQDVRVVRETEDAMAFEHTHPYWTTHIVVIPKRHIESLATVTEPDFSVLTQMLALASRICSDLQERFGGCRLSTNVGDFQSTKHLHFYIHSGERLRNEDGSPIV